MSQPIRRPRHFSDEEVATIRRLQHDLLTVTIYIAETVLKSIDSPVNPSVERDLALARERQRGLYQQLAAILGETGAPLPT